MDEPDRITQDQIIEINAKVESINHKMRFLLASNPNAPQYLDEFFGERKSWARIYLAADGKRTVEEIASALGMKRQNVNRPLCRLWEEGLLDRIPRKGQVIYVKNEIEKALKVSSFLKKKFNLQPDDY